MENEQQEKLFPFSRSNGSDVELSEYTNNCKLFERFFNLSMDLLCIAGVDGFFKLLNPAFDVLGYTHEELLSKSFLEFVHPDDISSTQLEIEKLSRGAPTIYFENRYRCKDGSYRWLGWTSMPEKTTGTLFAVARDITEAKLVKEKLRKRDEELDKQNIALKKAVQARDEMVGLISHEIKNPLAVLQMRTQLIQKLLPQDPKLENIRKLLEQQNPSIQRINQLISDLLDVTRLEAGAFKIEPRIVDLSEIVKEVIDSQKTFAHEKLLGLKGEIAPECQEVFCDSARTIQILTNLVHNAIKSTNSGGTIKITALQFDNQVEVQVIDTGIGITEECLPHVFDRFWQVKDTASKGTGLGLSIVKKLVQAQGGKVWVESQIGAGTTFHFTLPKSVASNRR